MAMSFFRAIGVSNKEAGHCLTQEQIEAQLAKEEALEREAKLEAMRMADYREQLRASCAASAGSRGVRGARPPSTPPSTPIAFGHDPQAVAIMSPATENSGCDHTECTNAGVERFELPDDNTTPAYEIDLDAMYDFSSFTAEGGHAAAATSQRSINLLSASPPASTTPLSYHRPFTEPHRLEIHPQTHTEQLPHELQTSLPGRSDHHGHRPHMSGSLHSQQEEANGSSSSSSLLTPALTEALPNSTAASTGDVSSLFTPRRRAPLCRQVAAFGPERVNAGATAATLVDSIDKVQEALTAIRSGFLSLISDLSGEKANAALVNRLMHEIGAADSAISAAKVAASAGTTTLMQIGEANNVICSRCQQGLDEQRKDIHGTDVDPLEGLDRAQVMELAQLTEELTEALEIKRAEIEETQRHLATTAERCRTAEAERFALEQQFVEKEAELKRIECQLAEKERRAARDEVRMKELEERVVRIEFECYLHEKLASKGSFAKFKHLEV